MALIPYRSLFDMDRFFDDEDMFFPVPSERNIFRPSMDIYEKGANVIAEMNVPGIDADKIEVSVKDGILHVLGISEEKKEEKEKGYWRKEIRKGSFERMVRLPVPVQENKIEATCESGILKIVMPKIGQKEGSKVKVKSVKTTPKKVLRKRT